MKYVVTGGAGFIGSHLTEKLLSEGHKVTVIDNNEDNIKRNLSRSLENENLNVQKQDIRDLKYMTFNDIDVVVHLAALADIVPSIEEPEKYFSNNVTGTLAVLDMARKSNVKRFVYAASSSCYGIAKQWPATEEAPINPMYPYAESKYLGERLIMHCAKVYKMQNTSLRFFNIFGPRSRTTGTYGAVFTTFLAQKAQGLPYTIVGDGEQSRDFLFVTDAVEAIIAASTSVQTGIYNIGSGQHYSIKYLVELLGYPKKVVHLPKRPGEPDVTLASIDKAQQELEWNPKVPFEQGVKFLVDNLEYYKDAKAWTEKEIDKATKGWFKYLKTDEPKSQSLTPG